MHMNYTFVYQLGRAQHHMYEADFESEKAPTLNEVQDSGSKLIHVIRDLFTFKVFLGSK